MIATTIEQSKELVRLGLDPKTADMCLCKTAQDSWVLHGYVPSEYDAHTVPAWSLDALLKVMRKLNVVVTLQMTEMATWLRIKGLGDIWHKDIHVKDPMDAVYGGMLWLFEQGLIEKGDNDE